MKKINLFFIGKGNIANALFKQIDNQKEFLKEKFNLELKVVFICDSKTFVFDENGLNIAEFLELESIKDYASESDLIEFLKNIDLENKIAVDCSIGNFGNFHNELLNANFKIVTANKKPLASDFEIYKKLVKNKLNYRYEATVGAGVPVVCTLQDLVNTGDEILEIKGCFSGTLGFVCSELQKGRNFSEIIKEAKELGYTESHPRDDLDGSDVARKVLILGREIGYEVNFSNIYLKGLIKEDLKQIDNVENFLEATKSIDEYYRNLVNEFLNRNKVPRFVGEIKDGKINVGLQAVDRDSDIGSLNGPDNIFVIKTKRYFKNPLVIKGPGAGSDVTAMGVFGDILKILNYFFKSF